MERPGDEVQHSRWPPQPGESSWGSETVPMGTRGASKERGPPGGHRYKERMKRSPRRAPARPDLEYGRSVVRAEAAALGAVLRRMGSGFLRAVDLLHGCRGNVVVTGVGKSGLVGQKISATLASTGTPSIYLHAAEALHGDVGRVRRDDAVLAISFSGESLCTM